MTKLYFWLAHLFCYFSFDYTWTKLSYSCKDNCKDLFLFPSNSPKPFWDNLALETGLVTISLPSQFSKIFPKRNLPEIYPACNSFSFSVPRKLFYDKFAMKEDLEIFRFLSLVRSMRKVSSKRSSAKIPSSIDGYRKLVFPLVKKRTISLANLNLEFILEYKCWNNTESLWRFTAIRIDLNC